jgi:hypothetical protein
MELTGGIVAIFVGRRAVVRPVTRRRRASDRRTRRPTPSADSAPHGVG